MKRSTNQLSTSNREPGTGNNRREALTSHNSKLTAHGSLTSPSLTSHSLTPGDPHRSMLTARSSRLSLLTSLTSSLLILLFTYTGTSKLLTHTNFLWVLQRSPILKTFAQPLSWIVPILELMIAALLFIPSWRRTGFLCGVILMVCFTIYIGYMLLFTPNLPCSCGGVIKELSWKQHLIFNFTFTALAFAGWKMQTKLKLFIAR
jgi:hypothetical protein